MTASARAQLKTVADRLSEEDARTVLSLAQKLAAARRQEAEDRADVEDALEALAEPGEVSLEALKAELGL